jgi:hypothetical protein
VKEWDEGGEESQMMCYWERTPLVWLTVELMVYVLSIRISGIKETSDSQSRLIEKAGLL